MRLPILDVQIDNLSKNEVLTKVEEFLCSDRQHLITTPNPEMIVLANGDWFFKQALNSADLAPADGFGLVLAAKYLYNQKIERFPGVELMQEICRFSEKFNKKIFLLGGEEGVADRVSKKLKEFFPNLQIVGAISGIKFTEKQNENSRKKFINWHFDENQNRQILEQIKAVAPDVLFVAFGHGKQEKWLSEFFSELPSIKIGMGVGGAFDFFANKITRAPKILRQLGLEWFWRLLKQPFYRFKRVIKAILVFSFFVILYKRTLKFPYRQNVVGFVINNQGNFFIGKRKKSDFDHWQPPQGGAEDGENMTIAVEREVKEETGLSTKVLCTCESKNIYDWPPGKLFRLRNFKYRGQIQKIFLLKYEGGNDVTQIDRNEFSDYKWVNLEEFKKMIHPMRQATLKILLRECEQKIKDLI